MSDQKGQSLLTQYLGEDNTVVKLYFRFEDFLRKTFYIINEVGRDRINNAPQLLRPHKLLLMAKR